MELEVLEALWSGWKRRWGCCWGNPLLVVRGCVQAFRGLVAAVALRDFGRRAASLCVPVGIRGLPLENTLVKSRPIG